MSELRQGFIDFLRERYAGLRELPPQAVDGLVAENLLCEHVVRLPRRALDRIHEIVRDFEALRDLQTRSGFLDAEMKKRGVVDPGHRSVMMSFDFHLDPQGEPRLIEINTNAAFHFLNTEMLAYRALASAVPDFGPSRLRDDILEELRGYRQVFANAFDPDQGTPPHVVITDEGPESQRMYLEFLVAQEWFRSFGWTSEIRELAAATTGRKADFVYNRCTDFYLEHGGRPLKEAINSGRACVAPNPFEYLQLADKERLIEWTTPGHLEKLGVQGRLLESVRRALPFSLDFASTTAEELWARRKSLFFKPKREFGSKKAFKGASISRKVFEELAGPETMAQEFIPAPEVRIQTPSGEQAFKYDLRCYSHGDRLEGVVARVYQGQVTNLKTPYGGFAPVVFDLEVV